MHCTRTALMLALLLSIGTPLGAEPSAAGSSDSPAARLAQVREALEAPFRQQAGIGFREFDCDLPASDGPNRAQEFSCTAIDEEGDRFIYRVWREPEDGESRVSQWQPPEQIPAASRATLAAVAEGFLGAFVEGNWTQLAASRHPALASKQSTEALRASLAPMRTRAGHLGTAQLMLVGQPDAGSFVLEYRLGSEQGPLMLRLQLRDADSGLAVSGYLLVPEDGSSLAAAMLAEQAAISLGALLDGRITGLDVDMQQLRRAGNAAVGQIQLQRGAALPVLVSRIGTAYDFDQNDYRFSILDLA